MKILIVGGTSSLGSTLKGVLSSANEVITAGRHDCDIAMDLRDPADKIIIPNDVEVVIHTAAHFGGLGAAEIIECENVNVAGTLKLCRAAVEANVQHFVLISSMSACVKEDSSYFGIYALSKRHGEEAAKFYCSIFSLPLTILRPTQIYGDSDDFRKHQPFIYSMVENAEKGENISVYGSNDALRNYIHADDLGTIISLVIKYKVTGIYSCAHPQDLRYSQVALAAIAAFNSRSGIHFLKDKPDIADNVFEEDDSLYKKINFYPRISIFEGMKRIATYKSSSR